MVSFIEPSKLLVVFVSLSCSLPLGNISLLLLRPLVKVELEATVDFSLRLKGSVDKIARIMSSRPHLVPIPLIHCIDEKEQVKVHSIRRMQKA